MSRGRFPGGWQLPTWLLSALAIGALGGAGWLFLAGNDGASEAPPTNERSEPQANALDNDDEQVEGELVLPENSGEPTDERRRGDTGRNTAGDDDDSKDESENSDAEPDADATPPVFANLAGRRIALAPASAAAVGRRTRLVRVGVLRVPCSAPRDADALAIELAVLDRVTKVLRNAEATVIRVDDQRRGVPCVDQRVSRAEAADFAVTIRSNVQGRGRALPGRSDAGGAVRPTQGSLTLAGDLAGALELAAPTLRLSTRDRTLLGEIGVIDRPKGADVALLEIGALDETVSSATLDSLATDIARGLAASAARAS